jgi:cytochrome c peroxidase
MVIKEWGHPERLQYLNLGVPQAGPQKEDLVRYYVTHQEQDKGAFKTPTLREIARTAPYMHDGRFKTLEEVVNFYNQGGIKNPHHDDMIVPLELTEQEQQDLVALLKSLNGEGWQHVRAPKAFPQ